MTFNYSQSPNINLYGTTKEVEDVVKILDTLTLTDDEKTDRLIIQEALADNPLFKKCGFLYEGNTIYPFEPIIKEFKKLKKAGSLSSMSDRFYSFLYLNFDIAHYDKMGYIYHYNDSFDELWSYLSCEMRHIPEWYSDLQRIVNEIFKTMN